ncbi:MAG: hypothetical protein LBL81_00090 [Tannerella sp.]|jgi:hypothetical protein|nr:hypothetical protein [Tannerella sp.]
MTATEKATIAGIQNALNYFVEDDYKREVDCLSMIIDRMYDENDKIQRVKSELDTALLHFGNLYESDYWVLAPLKDYAYSDNSLLDSMCLDTLQPDEREKYFNFNAVIDPKFEFESYSWNLPCFYSIKEFLFLYRFLDYLRHLLSRLEVRSVSSPKRTLESRLDATQIGMLTECLNCNHVFVVNITVEDLTDFFSCSLVEPLKVARAKNKLIVYALWQLECRNLITLEWQAVCAREKLLQSFSGNILSQNNLSSSLYQAKELPPKGSEIIDSYIKQMKKA